MQSAATETSETPLADYRQYYGLAEDPFQDDPDFEFFGGGARRALLEQLQHLCQFSASLLAVLGKPGVGKTRMALELANSFEPEDEVCLLNAEPGAEAADVLAQMAHHFSLPVEESPSIGRLLAALRHFAQVADNEDRLALTIIDDAHHLDEKTLGALISLLQGQDSSGRRLHIVLFADPEMVTRLDQFNMHDVLIHDFELAPFSLDEATDYLNFRMEICDYMGPEVFTEERVEPWWRRAEGRLPRLHTQARQWLLESVTPEPGKPKGRTALPVVHIVVVAVLLGVLLMVFVYSGGSDETADDNSTVVTSRDTQTVTLPSSASQREASNQGAGTPQNNPSSQAGTPQNVTSPDPLPQTPEVSTPVPSEAPTESAAETEGEALSESSVSASAVEAENPTTDPRGSASSSPSPTEEAATPKASQLPEIPEDEQVILSWRPTDFTLQLLGASSRESVQRYLSEQPNRSQLLSFESRRQGEPWFVVVTGRYNSSEEAREAVEQLPSAQRSAGPWPRQVKDIQSEIETLRELSR